MCVLLCQMQDVYIISVSLWFKIIFAYQICFQLLPMLNSRSNKSDHSRWLLPICGRGTNIMNILHKCLRNSYMCLSWWSKHFCLSNIKVSQCQEHTLQSVRYTRRCTLRMFSAVSLKNALQSFTVYLIAFLFTFLCRFTEWPSKNL